MAIRNHGCEERSQLYLGCVGPQRTGLEPGDFEQVFDDPLFLQGGGDDVDAAHHVAVLVGAAAPRAEEARGGQGGDNLLIDNNSTVNVTANNAGNIDGVNTFRFDRFQNLTGGVVALHIGYRA